MGARLGHIALYVVFLLGGCSSTLDVPKDQSAAEPTTPVLTATPIPEPTRSADPYADPHIHARQVAETFVRNVLEYDATTEDRTAFMGRVAPITTHDELDRLRRSPRAHLDWRTLRARQERVELAVTGVSVSSTGRIVVRAERTTRTTFATVRDFIAVDLELVGDGQGLRVAHAEGGGL